MDMGNKKNQTKKRKNSHRHVFVNRKKRVKNKDNKLSINKETVRVQGSRIINIDKLQRYSEDLVAHSKRCDGTFMLAGEHRDGLASIFTGHCSNCQHTITLETSNKVRGPKGYRRWECNLAAVWSQMVTGAGHSQLQESMSILGIPVMTKKSFMDTEKVIGEFWKSELKESMADAGREERRIAVEKGSYHEGVPAITVIVDGGWSKRAHKHSYNAKSGVGIIIGKETGKLLYIGVRNKYCHACARGISQENHTCYKNWSKSSSEMEADAILEGFLEAERVHGLRYTKFIGDGDSSVYPTLLQNVLGWGHAIRKLECANHACKCYRSALERLIQSNPSYKGSGKLTEKMRKKLVTAARCAIRMRSEESDRTEALKALRKDLVNGPRHCFGLHDDCSPDFCTKARNHPSQATSSGDGDEETTEDPADEPDDLDGKHLKKKKSIKARYRGRGGL